IFVGTYSVSNCNKMAKMGGFWGVRRASPGVREPKCGEPRARGRERDVGSLATGDGRGQATWGGEPGARRRERGRDYEACPERSRGAARRQPRLMPKQDQARGDEQAALLRARTNAEPPARPGKSGLADIRAQGLDLVRLEPPPTALGHVAQAHRPEGDALEVDHVMPQRLQQAADLALLALGQRQPVARLRRLD